MRYTRAFIALVAVVGLLALAIVFISASESTGLRIENVGTQEIKKLRVGFGGQWFDFGDVSPGEVTDYVEVPTGVFSYAAYEHEWEGEVIGQPVRDWFGEVPLEGE